MITTSQGYVDAEESVESHTVDIQKNDNDPHILMEKMKEELLQTETSKFDYDHEIKFEKIRISKRLGAGAFGEVWRY